MNDTIANRNNRLQIRPDLLICLFLVIAILSVYWQVRNYEFINFDDDNMSQTILMYRPD